MKKVLMCIIALIVSVPAVWGQISPGELSKAHANLEGIRNCVKCHKLGDKVTNEKCLDCHTEIATRIQQHEGYHASSEVQGKDCSGCHNEHHGRDFDMLNLDKTTFNHNLTGFTLQGAHKRTDCQACHKKEFITDTKLKDKKLTYLGLSQQCLSCHQDYHQQTLSDNCTECHNFESFKTVPGFHHNQTAFPLKGKHAEVTCVDCHQKETIDGKPFQHFADVPHANCTSCHEDVHHNKFGQTCTRCHSEQSWGQIKGMANFDHNKTGFPLQGLHSKVACQQCHKNNYAAPLAHNRCSDCHTDYHKGDFTRTNTDSDCKDCHTVKGFQFTNYTIEKHNLSNFKLNGAHMATPCFSCHKKEDRWRFRNIGSNCIDCHQNVHSGFMDDQYTLKDGCNSCHDENAWSEVSFDHSKTGFALSGVHAQTNCGACHYTKGDNGKTVQRFAKLNPSCTECHQDIHHGQFARYGDEGCSRCHGFDDWSASKFDHNQARFKLEGAHASVSCVSCHPQVKSKDGSYTKYTYKSIECATCHN